MNKKYLYFDVISPLNFVYICKSVLTKGDVVFSDRYNKPMKPLLLDKVFVNNGVERLSRKAKEIFIDRKK